MATNLAALVQQVVSRIPADELSEAAPAQTADRNDAIQQRLNALLYRIGPRYRHATLASYQATTVEQRSAVAKLRAYADNLRDEVKSGRGILLFGPTGTGKDHLLIGLAKIAVAKGCEVLWVNGIDLQAKLRDAIQHDESEESVLKSYRTARVLVLSDPLPPAGVLSDYQAATLYRLADHRYRNLSPTWCSLNVANAGEARKRLGAATVDRLRDGALAIECKWPSYRRARA